FNTYKLAKETSTQNRAQVRKEKTTGASTSGSSSKHKKVFSLYTYKLHAMGDYADAIELLGTTDSYSTQIVRNFLSVF
ncbi:hypothetical protein BDV93DRAFT_456545, partial [Ceratobasidium sp. AG-I]